MTDYAATPLQPIAQGLVTFPAGVGGALALDSTGVEFIVRDPATGGQGGYILTLDPGLPGNAGAVPPGIAPFPEPDVRVFVQPRGTGVPPVSGIAVVSVAYITSPLPGVGVTEIEITMQNIGLGFVDPAAGFEFIVWKGFGNP